MTLYKLRLLKEGFLLFSKKPGLSPFKQQSQRSDSHTASVIFFHGLGDSGSAVRGWMNPHIKNRQQPHIRFLFPTAPSIHYTPYDETLNAWFNKYDSTQTSEEHADSLNAIRRTVQSLIDKETSSGVPVNRIVVGGFSMGGALALHLGYRWEPEVAGVFALSSTLQKNSAVFDALRSGTGNAPLFMRHGDRDDVIPLEWGEKTFEKLSQLGVRGDFQVVPDMEHDVDDGVIEELLEWIEGLLN